MISFAPNGIVGARDGSRVYVADHGAGHTYVFTPAEDGALTDKRLFVSQGADGMTMDELGNVYLTGPDITIYNPDGALIAFDRRSRTPCQSHIQWDHAVHHRQDLPVCGRNGGHRSIAPSSLRFVARRRWSWGTC